MLQIKRFLPVLIGVICISCASESTTQQLSSAASQAIGTAFVELQQSSDSLKDTASTCSQSVGVGFVASALLQEWEQMHALELESLIANS